MIHDDAPVEHAALIVDGEPVEVVSLEGREAVSELFRFEIGCREPGGRAASSLLGRPAEITLRDGFGGARVIAGIVAEVRSTATEADGRPVTLVVRPALYRATLRRNCRAFQHADVVTIARRLVEPRGVPLRLSLGRRYAVREYCAQYREDDHTFLSRLLEEEGIFAYFDHEGGSTALVLADDSTASPDLEGGADLEFRPQHGMTGAREAVTGLVREASATSTRFTLRSFDPRRPALDLTAKAGDGALEVYSAAGGGPDEPEVLAMRARDRLERARAARAWVSGTTTSVRLWPGRALRLVGHPQDALDGRYFLTEVETRVHQRRRDGAGPDRSYACTFRAIPRAVPYRPPARTPRGEQPGLQSGIVVGQAGSDVHHDEAGRVRVQLAWDREGARDHRAGTFMRVAQRSTVDSLNLPRVGATVLTVNEEGAAHAPGVLARLHDGERPPAYALPAHKTRVVWKTATVPGDGAHNEIHFEDALGAEEIFMNASRNMSLVVKDARLERVVQDSTRSVGRDHEIHVSGSRHQTVGHDQTVTVGADEATDIGGAFDESAGSLTETVGGPRSLHVGGAHTTTVEDARTLVVGAALVGVTLGGMQSSADDTHVVIAGGALVRAARQSISSTAGKDAWQAVGGLRLEIAGHDWTLVTDEDCSERAGAAALFKTDGAAVVQVEETASLSAAGTLAATADTEIAIGAETKIEVRCGSSVLTVEKDQVTITADAFDLREAKLLEAQAKAIRHNC